MDEIPKTWQRLVDDVRNTTGLTLLFERKPLPGADVEWCASVPDGYFGPESRTWFRTYEDTLSPEDALAEMIDYLQEQLFHEHIWGGWPICPVHNTHPLDLGQSEPGECKWRCPVGAYGPVRVGELQFKQHVPWRDAQR